MKNIERLFKNLKSNIYEVGGDPTDYLHELAQYCLELLGKDAQLDVLPTESAGGKQYFIYRANGQISRPLLDDMFVTDHAQFKADWQELWASIDPKGRRISLPSVNVNRTLYTALMAFSICFDLWKPKSRKTPGTYFEVLVGSVLSVVLEDWTRSKAITLPGETEKVSTDIVMSPPDTRAPSLVFPVKITTRERIVQPYAHQRILDSFFGAGKFKSVLICGSEMQRDEEEGAKEICVPGTIRLFQKHLAPIAAIYYLDPPQRYLQDDLKKIVKVGNLGDFFSKDLAALSR